MFFKLKTKWWKQKRGGGACVGGGGEGGVAELGMQNVLGVFLVTLVGCVIATMLAFFEFFLGTKQQSEELGSTWMQEIITEFKFAMQCYGNTKVRPLCA